MTVAIPQGLRREDLSGVRGTIFNIQRCCTHDGPGIRTTVFVKGCPLRCPWCHNPEGIEQDREITYDPARCLGCRACLQVCEHGVHEFTEEGEHLRHGERCVRCGICAEHCFAGALEVVGEEKTAGEVIEVVQRDRPFYDCSGGGVTLSGGEPLYQPEFAAAILWLCRQEGIATAIETSCLTTWSVVQRFLPLVDYWICDLKHPDPQRHRELTGADNRQLLDNLRHLGAAGVSLLIRFPLIPGLNDDEPGLRRLGYLVAEIAPSEGMEIMPYHRIGQGKYERLDRKYPLAGIPEVSDDDLRRAAALLRQGGADRVFCQRLPGL